jgi:hypothetical protein
VLRSRITIDSPDLFERSEEEERKIEEEAEKYSAKRIAERRDCEKKGSDPYVARGDVHTDINQLEDQPVAPSSPASSEKRMGVSILR